MACCASRRPGRKPEAAAEAALLPAGPAARLPRDTEKILSAIDFGPSASGSQRKAALADAMGRLSTARQDVVAANHAVAQQVRAHDMLLRAHGMLRAASATAISHREISSLAAPPTHSARTAVPAGQDRATERHDRRLPEAFRGAGQHTDLALPARRGAGQQRRPRLSFCGGPSHS